MKFLKNNKRILIASLLIIVLPGILVGLVIYLKNYAWKTVILEGCGSNLPNYKYSIDLPGEWTVSKQTEIGQSSKYTSHYNLQKNNKKLTISCTTQGVGSDICDDKYRTKFTIGNQSGEACYSQLNGIWEMGVLNLPRDPSTNATIGLWAHNIEPTTLNKILFTFKVSK